MEAGSGMELELTRLTRPHLICKAMKRLWTWSFVLVRQRKTEDVTYTGPGPWLEAPEEPHNYGGILVSSSK